MKTEDHPDDPGSRRTASGLESSEGRLQLVVENAPIVLWAIDTEGRFTLSTGSGLAGLGLREGEALGLSAFEMYGNEPDVVSVLRRALSGETVTQIVRLQGRAFQSALRPLRDADGRVSGVIGVATDITAQQEATRALARAERAKQESQRLEALGRLAGGVAHEFSNKLTVIAGFARLLERELEAGHPARNDVEQIRTAADHATRLVQEMLAFARSAPNAAREHRLDDIVRQSASLLGPLLDERVSLELDLKAGETWVLVDHAQLEQVLVNLALNARDAMPNGGLLRIATETTEVTAYQALPLDLKAGPHVSLTVEDSGAGMSSDVCARVFEPFFTTKGVGEGTGLGLATCHGIVGSAGGHIGVDSRLGEGTTFTILLPTCAPAQGTGVEPEAPPSRPGRGETILVVEDDARVREFAGRVLADRGYHVIEAANGREALERVREKAVDLVISDVVMPELGGSELARALRSQQPGLPVLLVSGHVGEEDIEALMEHEAFLAKPYSPEELAHTVRRLLDRVAAPQSPSAAPSGSGA